jgi:hypothetical protein
LIFDGMLDALAELQTASANLFLFQGERKRARAINRPIAAKI